MRPVLLDSVVSGVVAIDKPAGLSCHPVAGSDDSVSTWLLNEAPDELRGFQLAHRLDKPVSGVLLLGASDGPLQAVQRAFETSGIEKLYVALVPGATRAKGVIRRGLKDSRRRKTLDCITRYRRLWTNGRFSLLGVSPETGRKHQIRRHLEGLGHPIVNDQRYRNRRSKHFNDLDGRIWLHCYRLVWDERRWVSPLPTRLLASLGRLGVERSVLASMLATIDYDHSMK